jgi:hypothetical protein
VSDFDAAMVRRWLGILHGDAPGLLNIVSTGNWAGVAFPTDQLDRAVDYVGVQHRAGRAGIYVRVTTLREAPEVGKRSGADNTLSLPALWADLDLAGPGHAEGNLPPDVEAGQKVITVSGLPDPTIWVHSGGGLYPIWLLTKPHVIGDDLAQVKELTAGWQKVIEHAAAGLGWKYGAGVGDLARVLRIPGTVNRKPEMPEPEPCRIIAATANRYPIADLYRALEDGLARIPQPTLAAPVARANTAPTAVRSSINLEPGDLTPADDWAARTDWADILAPHGWTLSHAEEATRFWTRPGKTTGISATTNHEGTDRLYVFTTSTAFEANDSYSKLGALAILEYNGDHRAAVKALRARGYGSPLPDPAQLQREVLRDLLGATPPAPPPPPAPTVRLDGPAPLKPWSPEVDVTNPAIAEAWLRQEVGRGRLAGMFYRAPGIVYTPREGEDGYQPVRGGDQMDGDDGPAQVRPITGAVLASRVQCTFGVFRMVKRGEDWVPVPALFARHSAQPVVDTPDAAPNLRTLRGVVHSPVVRPDGSVLATPGYDQSTGLLYLPEPGLEVPPILPNPSTGDVAAAVRVLLYMIQDFTFLSDHDRANYLGLLLTPLLRAMVPPPYKLAAIGAPQPGSGKTLLANILRHLHGGVFRSEMPEDDAELRKQVTTILDYTTGPVVHFDNVSGVLRSSTLAGLLTSARWDDRRLGGNEMVNARNDRLWVITGNNVALGGDLIRRTLWVTIDPGVPNPHLRTDFAIPDLEGWVHRHRGTLIHALLTLVRAWVMAGQPTVARSGDSYRAWLATVGGILAVAGVPGAFDHPESIRQELGTEDDEWRDFLAAIHHAMGDRVWTVKELLGYVNTGLLVAQAPIPLDALPGDLSQRAIGAGGLMGISRSLGRWLMHRAGRWAGPYAVRSVGREATTNTNRFQIQIAEGH